jgi:hypothetical protein
VRRLTSRRLDSDEGLSLVETIAALLVFALIMSGLAAGMALYAHTTALTKAKNAATSVAQQVMETARTLSVGNLAVCTGGGAPANYTYKTQSLPVVTGSTPCLQYSQTKTVNGIPFTVNQIVVTLNSTTINSQPISEKMLVVTVSWTKPAPGSYTTSSTMTGNGTVASTTPVGVQFSINDQNGNLVSQANLTWDYTVTDSNGNQLASGQTDDGTSGLLSVSPGTYTCQVVAETDAGQSYDPGTNPGMTVDAPNDTITNSTCTVSANTVTDMTTVWNEVASCVPSGTKGPAKITVLDSQNQPVYGATVSVTNAGTTGANGTVTNQTLANNVNVSSLNVAADLYTYVVSKTGYQTSTIQGPICVAPAAGTSAQVNLQSVSTCVVANATASTAVTLTAVDENLAPVNGAKFTLANQDGKTSPAAKTATASSNSVVFSNIAAGNWKVTVSKTGWTNIGPQGPFCVAANTNSNAYQASLPTSGSSGCVSTGSKGGLTVPVTDQAAHPIGGVKVTLTNANGHGGVPPAQTTDNTTGVATWASNTTPGDLYTYVVTVPAGYLDPGVQGPICVVAGATTPAPAVVLTAYMIVKVTVTNSDTQPTKTYNVILRDSSNNTSSNSITVNKSKSGTVTFSSMPTDTYTIEVCVPVASTGDCDDIANTTSTTYNFGSKGLTYNVAITDPKFGA